MYTERIMKRFKDPKFVGEIEDADGIGEVGNVRCGDIMKVYIKVKDNIISEIKFKTYGCVAAIVSTDFLCELVQGKTLEEAEKITSKDVVKVMGDVPPVKLHCSVLAQKALRKAIDEYRKNKTSR